METKLHATPATVIKPFENPEPEMKRRVWPVVLPTKGKMESITGRTTNLRSYSFGMVRMAVPRLLTRTVTGNGMPTGAPLSVLSWHWISVEVLLMMLHGWSPTLTFGYEKKRKLKCFTHGLFTFYSMYIVLTLISETEWIYLGSYLKLLCLLDCGRFLKVL